MVRLFFPIHDNCLVIHNRVTVECIIKVRYIPFLVFNIGQSGPVVETLAYDLLLEAAMRAHRFHSRNLKLQGPWKWLLAEFADYYGVSDSYTKLRFEH